MNDPATAPSAVVDRYADALFPDGGAFVDVLSRAGTGFAPSLDSRAEWHRVSTEIGSRSSGVATSLASMLGEHEVERVELACIDLDGPVLVEVLAEGVAVPADLLLVSIHGAMEIDRRLVAAGWVPLDRFGPRWLYAAPHLAAHPFVEGRRLQVAYRTMRRSRPDFHPGEFVEFDIVRGALAEMGVDVDDWPELVDRAAAASSFPAFEGVDRTYSTGDPLHHQIFEQPHRVAPPVDGFVIEDAALSFDVTAADRPEFYVFDRGRRLVNGLGYGATPFLDPIRERRGPASLIEDPFVADNLCHLAVDKLPRGVRAAEATGISDVVVFHCGDLARHLGALVGLRVDGLATAGRRGTIGFDRLVVFGNSFGKLRHPLHYGDAFHLDYLDRMRAAAVGAAPARRFGRRPPRRVLVHRQNASGRRIANYLEVQSALAEIGVVAIDPGTMSARRQVGLFASAELVVGVHGAGLTHAMFLPAGGVVVEILPPMVASGSYAHLCELLPVEYRYQIAADAELGHIDPRTITRDMGQNRRDVVVDVDHLVGLIGGTVPSGHGFDVVERWG